MRISALLVVLCFASSAFAQPPAGYYDNVQGLNGDALRTALMQIIDGHSQQSYGSLHTHYQSTDVKPNGQVWDMYTDIPGSTPVYIFQFNNGQQCGNYAAEGDCYNREHSFPKSWFNSNYPMYSDLFAVYPTDGYTNGQRSNYPYSEVGNAQWTSSNGSKRGTSNYPGYSGNAFEPIDEYKGDFARSYFYMLTRYKNQVSSWNSVMLNGDNFSEWAESLLKDWHHQDAVSAKEIDRNNAVYAIQGNRNPFIDQPNWVDSIWITVDTTSNIDTTINVGQLELAMEPVQLQYVAGDVYLTYARPISGVLTVHDLAGRPVMSQMAQANQNYPISGLPKGIYIVSFEATNGLRSVLKIALQ